MTQVTEHTSNTTQSLVQAPSQKSKTPLCMKIWIIVSIIIVLLIVVVSCLSLALIIPAWSIFVAIGALLISSIIIKILSGRTKNLETATPQTSSSESPKMSEVQQPLAEQASDKANESTPEDRPSSPITHMERMIEKISLKSSEETALKGPAITVIANDVFKIVEE
ncbi:MAG: hypothetical protein RSB82_02270 [Victivallaceae bacterium]